MSTSAQDRLDVINVVNLYFQLSDAKDFSGARALLADQLTVDFGGVNPDAEGLISADDMERSARALVGPVALTQHVITNQVVTNNGDEATVAFYEQALHHHPDLGEDQDTNTWTLYGRGEYGLRRTPDGWKIESKRLRAVHHVGNRNLLADVARQREPAR